MADEVLSPDEVYTWQPQPIILEPEGAKGSPEWWRDRILAVMAAEYAERRLYDDYYHGDHVFSFATSRYANAFRELLRKYQSNWCRVAVDAATERMVVEGFRDAETEEESADAWLAWEENGLTEEADIAHMGAQTHGTSYLLVGLHDDGTPAILVESAFRARVVIDNADSRHRLAGLQHYIDSMGDEVAVLWLEVFPGTVVENRWRRDPEDARDKNAARKWRADIAFEHPLPVVPLIPIRNAPTGRYRLGWSDLADLVPMQNAINKLGMDLLVASEFAAFRQRYATGIEIPVDANGAPMTDAFISSLSRLWTSESPDTRFGEFQATDLTNYTNAIDHQVQTFSARSRTPPNYLVGKMVNVSADAIRAAEAGLVSKVRSREKLAGSSHVEAVALCTALRNKTAPEAPEPGKGLEAIWRDPETRTIGERTDSAVKLKALDVPREALWLSLPGVTENTVANWSRMLEEQRESEPPPAVPEPGSTGAQGSNQYARKGVPSGDVEVT